MKYLFSLPPQWRVGMHSESRETDGLLRCSLNIKIWMLQFIRPQGCELEVWGFTDVNKGFFCGYSTI